MPRESLATSAVEPARVTREITVLRGFAGTDVPHPRLIAGCENTSVLGVVFYLMELVDGVSPGEEVTPEQRDDVGLRHGQGLTVALARLGGLPTRRELVTAYTEAAGRAPAHIDWYTALAGFKLGVVLEGTWARASAGKA